MLVNKKSKNIYENIIINSYKLWFKDKKIKKNGYEMTPEECFEIKQFYMKKP
jgi:hypothetical protein